MTGAESALTGAIGAVGLVGWVRIRGTARNPYAQGRRARLITAQLAVFAIMTWTLWRTEPAITPLFLGYLHAAVIAVVELAVVRWRTGQIWSGVRL